MNNIWYSFLILLLSISQPFNTRCAIGFKRTASFVSQMPRGFSSANHKIRSPKQQALYQELEENTKLIKENIRLQKQLDNALFNALKKNITSSFLQLLTAGADACATDQQGRTPLHIAARMGNVQAVLVLLEKGASATVADTKRKTPVTEAIDCYSDHTGTHHSQNALRLLIEASAHDPHDRKMALQHAARYGTQDACLVLLTTPSKQLSTLDALDAFVEDQIEELQALLRTPTNSGKTLYEEALEQKKYTFATLLYPGNAHQHAKAMKEYIRVKIVLDRSKNGGMQRYGI